MREKRDFCSKKQKSKLKALELNSIEYKEVLKEKESLENEMADLDLLSKKLSEDLEAKKIYHEEIFKDYIQKKVKLILINMILLLKKYQKLIKTPNL